MQNETSSTRKNKKATKIQIDSDPEQRHDKRNKKKSRQREEMDDEETEEGIIEEEEEEEIGDKEEEFYQNDDQFQAENVFPNPSEQLLISQRVKTQLHPVREHNFVFIEDPVTGEFTKVNNTPEQRAQRSKEEHKLTKTAQTAAEEGRNMVQWLIKLFSLSNTTLSKMVAGFSLCVILTFVITPLRETIIYDLCAAPSLFPLVFTTIYEVFTLSVLLGKIVTPVLISQAKNRGLKLKQDDVYWRFGDLHLNKDDSSKKNPLTKASAQGSASSSSSNNGQSQRGIEEQKSRRTPEEQRLRRVARYIHWIIAVMFMIGYILCTVADMESVALRDTQDLVGYASAWAWAALILSVAGLCFLSSIVDIIGEWWIQREIVKLQQKTET